MLAFAIFLNQLATALIKLSSNPRMVTKYHKNLTAIQPPMIAICPHEQYNHTVAIKSGYYAESEFYRGVMEDGRDAYKGTTILNINIVI